MTIGIDIRVLARGTRTGMEEYALNLLSCLLPLDRSINYRLFYNAFSKKRLDFPWLALANVKLYNFNIFIKGLDVYFNPHFFAAPLSKNCRKIITFHDLSFEHFPEFFSWRKRLWHDFLMNTRQEAEKADRIIAVSESTKQDLINIYNINPEKIKVIYSGINDKFKPIKSNNQIRQKYNLPDEFILYFGTIEPRKNLIGLIKAFELIRHRHKIKLVIAGTKGWLYKKRLHMGSKKGKRR